METPVITAQEDSFFNESQVFKMQALRWKEIAVVKDVPGTSGMARISPSKHQR
jgi:hypothetical protein